MRQVMSTLQKAVGVAGQPGCQAVSDKVNLNSTMPVSLHSHRDTAVCDSGSESMGFSDTDTEVGPNIKETLLSIRALNGDAESINPSDRSSLIKIGTNGIGPSQTCMISNSSTSAMADDAKLSDNGCEITHDKMPQKSVRKPVDTCCEILIKDDDAPGDELPVDEEEEFRLLLDAECDADEYVHDKMKFGGETDTGGDNISQDEISNTAEEEGNLPSMPDRVISPVSDSGSSPSVSKLDQEGGSKQSDCDSVSSNSSKKHPLLIGKSVKCSFKGIMKTVVSRVSQDSDSVKSSPRREDNSKPSSPKPDSSMTGAVDLTADSYTTPPNRNLFEKLGLISRTESSKDDVKMEHSSASASLINTNKQQDRIDLDYEDISERTDTPIELMDESMELDAPKQDDNDNSRVTSPSANSTNDTVTSQEKKSSIKDDDTRSQEAKTKTDNYGGLCVATKENSRCRSPEVKSNMVPSENKLCNIPKKCVKNESESDMKEEVTDSSYPDVTQHKLKYRSKDPNLLAVKKEKCSDKVDIKSGSDTEDPDNTTSSKGSAGKLSEGVKIEPDEIIKDVVKDSCDRKRSAVEESEEVKPKRSRLDFVIGKLGNQIGISPENIKCDEVMFDSDVDESGKESSESTENRSEDVTSEEDDTSSGTSSKLLTEEALEVIIKQKIKEVLEQQKEMLTKQFQAKIDELQTSNEAWKSQAKELHRKAVELMTQQQRQERRRAARISGQRRNVGIQVGEFRINSLSPHATSKHGLTSPSQSSAVVNSPGQVSLLNTKPSSGVSSTSTPSTSCPPNNQVLVQKMPIPSVSRTVSASQKPKESTVKSILNHSRIGQLSHTPQSHTVNSQTTVVTHRPTGSSKPGTGQPAPTSAGGQSVVKVIDLTSDEENSSSTSGKGPARAVPAGQSILNSTVYRQGTSASTLQPGTRIVLSSAAGTQLVSTPTALSSSQPRQPGVQYQYLYTPTSQAVRPANLVTVVSPPPGSSSSTVRTIVTPASTVTPAPPQLTRPLTTARSTHSAGTTVRAPPPLQSAPTVVSKPSTPDTVSVDKADPKAAPASVPDRLEPAKPPEPPKHPAPLPAQPANQDLSDKYKPLPPKPGLKISRVSQGIVLSWNMLTSSTHAEIASYQLFAYQETSAPLSSNLWKKVGDVKALPLPMACTLTQFQEGNKYHFAVRAVDVHGRVSVFSDPSTIHLVAQTSK